MMFIWLEREERRQRYRDRENMVEVALDERLEKIGLFDDGMTDC